MKSDDDISPAAHVSRLSVAVGTQDFRLNVTDGGAAVLTRGFQCSLPQDLENFEDCGAEENDCR